MTLVPRSLLWRTVLILAVLLVLAQSAFVVLVRLYDREPRARQIAQQVVSIVNLSRSALVSAQPSKRFDLLRELSSREGIRIYDAEHEEKLEELPDLPVLRIAAEHVREELGPDTRILTQREGIPGVWVSFRIGEDEFWVAMPRARIDRQFPWQWAGWGLLVLAFSLAGAYWIVSRINRPLKRLAGAAGTIGRGHDPEPVAEAGPAEIQALARAFNAMAADLKRNDAERALLLAGVSHDLRTPLTRLRLGVEMMGNGGTDPVAQGMIEDIQDMDAIIDQFLDFARDGSTEPVEELGDLNAIARELAERQRRRGRAVTDQLEPLPPVALRPMATQRMITNLVDNAFRYGGGEVEIRTAAAGGEVRLSVLDRGPGIPAEEAERMLRPFTRLDTARGGSTGSGLGLAIVDRIARLHGGRVELLAREGGGLEARVTLPAGRVSA